MPEASEKVVSYCSGCLQPNPHISEYSYPKVRDRVELVRDREQPIAQTAESVGYEFDACSLIRTEPTFKPDVKSG